MTDNLRQIEELTTEKDKYRQEVSDGRWRNFPHSLCSEY
jgi:hypothetical protein